VGLKELIELRQAGRIYNSGEQSLIALHPVDLVVREGEFVCIAGPSGSGKTTLLNLIGGLDAPSTGKVTIAGEMTNGLSPRSSARMRLDLLGFVFQTYNLIPVLTAYENVEYVLLLKGMPASERKTLVTSALRRVGLENQMKKFPREMSGGQQQRVAVARAIVAAPPIVLADEPTANLDSSAGKDLLDLLFGLNREQKITFVFSSHDLQIVCRARRVITLLDGRIANDSGGR
jgi:putative ABC transport system ATP-binding protein